MSYSRIMPSQRREWTLMKPPPYPPPPKKKRPLFVLQGKLGDRILKGAYRYLSVSLRSLRLAKGRDILSLITQHFQLHAGKTPYKAFSEWFISNGTRGTYVEEPLDKPECNPSCCSKLCLKCRKPKPTVAYDEATDIIIGNSK